MQGPTPRQQAGYLRRLLRRGALEILDPSSRQPLPVTVELHGQVVRILPLLGGRQGPAALPPGEQRWFRVLNRLRSAMTLEEAEQLATAVEIESTKAAAIESIAD
jgi:hypothetical protein